LRTGFVVDLTVLSRRSFSGGGQGGRVKDLHRWCAVILVAVACAACGGGGNASSTEAEEAGEAALEEAKAKAPAKAIPVYREVTLPAGTTLRLDLTSGIASDSSQVEDAVRATVREALVIEGQTVVPMGAALAGVVTDVADSGRVKGRARIAYRFNSLTVGDEQYDIATAPTSHLAPATKSEDATKIGIGAGAGAAIGAILGGGSGAAKGAVIGGAAGTGAVLATKGEEVRLGPGANVTTRLTAPLTVRIKI
jgi:hypothetical protein